MTKTSIQQPLVVNVAKGLTMQWEDGIDSHPCPDNTTKDPLNICAVFNITLTNLSAIVAKAGTGPYYRECTELATGQHTQVICYILSIHSSSYCHTTCSGSSSLPTSIYQCLHRLQALELTLNYTKCWSVAVQI